MVKIVTDSGSLFTPAEGAAEGIHVLPLNVTIAGETYREMDEIFPKQFLDIIYKGNLPTSSQPSAGLVMDAFEKATAEDPVIYIAMADGLSGTYSSGCGIRESVDTKEYVTVVNSRTLCGPERIIVKKAKALADQGKSAEEVVAGIQKYIDNTKSFLIPMDFDYLRRGGRLSATAAKVGGLLKLVPIMTQGEGGKNLEKAGMCRSFEKAVEKAIEGFQRMGVDSRYLLTVSHADNEKQGKIAVDMLKNAFPGCEIELVDLTCAFITQGGPLCVAIQAGLND